MIFTCIVKCHTQSACFDVSVYLVSLFCILSCHKFSRSAYFFVWIFKVPLNPWHTDADDEGEESAQKSSEDSDNASEAGEEVTGSESGEDQSEHDEEEEEEEDEQEGKAESEGEAEGMADADDGDADGNSSLASPDRSFALCKPLAAYTGFSEGLVVGSHPRKDGRIFYGNDLFYILFRCGALNLWLFWPVFIFEVWLSFEGIGYYK